MIIRAITRLQHYDFLCRAALPSEYLTVIYTGHNSAHNY